MTFPFKTGQTVLGTTFEFISVSYDNPDILVILENSDMSGYSVCYWRKSDGSVFNRTYCDNYEIALDIYFFRAFGIKL